MPSPTFGRTPITSPFGARATARAVVADRDLRGKTVVVTGGASGLGLETTRALVSGGADVVIGARDVAAARAVATELMAEDPRGSVAVLPLDLLDPRSIVRFAAAFHADRSGLDVLICNAGISYTPESHAPNGYELRFATNHLGHFRLFSQLRSALEAAAPSRVVVVSSAAHKHAPVVFEDIHYRGRPFDPFQAYGQSKSANVLFAVELTARYAERGVVANALSPGTSLTRLQRFIPRERMIANGLLNADGTPVADVRSTEQGAATSVWAAVDPALDGIGGLYLEDCREAGPCVEGVSHPWQGYAPHARNPENAARLWQESLRMS